MLSRRHANGDFIGVKEYNPAIVFPYTNLHLTAEHPEALHASYLTLLDGEGFVTRVKDGT